MLLLLSCCLVGVLAATGREVNEQNLHQLLTPAEWTALLGSSASAPPFAVVRPYLSHRRKRSMLHEEFMVLEATALGQRFELTLQRSPTLLDPHFVLLHRWSNVSEMLPATLALNEQNCYYYSHGQHRAALGLCNGMRGIITSERDEYYTISPLPQRFETKSVDTPHILVQWQGGVDEQSLNNAFLPYTRLKRHQKFVDAKQPSSRLNLNTLRRLHPETVKNQIVSAGKTSFISVSDVKNYERNILPNKRVDLINLLLETNFTSFGKSLQMSSGTKPFQSDVQYLEDKGVANAWPRRKRSLLSLSTPVHVETAVFIDRDLYQHMSINFPTDTERELIQIVLAMINAVQLLYHDPSLGRKVNFVLKRLEILHVDPTSLQRHHNIDSYLSSFCTWQRGENPVGDSNPLHWDHALILTGLDLYVVSKNGKVSSQVVGLAPVAGMCTATSSCTVNEGRHFESVYVVAHEIGHNLGMRHDGPLADNECDPGSYIMSPTLGSGKITWSSCSRRYLQMFLETSQSQCLLDHSTSSGQLDHSAEGSLPGERFDANQQCILKYGRGTTHSSRQPLDDICRDLHCQRDRYTWTSHPALEGTYCGSNKWCRSGHCIERGMSTQDLGFSTSRRVDGSWSDWSAFSECASGCLYGVEGRLHAGSTGIMVATRRCNNPRPENGGAYCQGSDRRFRTCNAEQCGNVQRTTLRDFADQICLRAREVDTELLGTGLQRTSSDPEEACTVWCYKRNGGSKSRGWTFPDGTTCQSRRSRYGKTMYCISGRCEEFVCDRYGAATFSNPPELCPGEGSRLHTSDSSFSRNKGHRRAAGDGQAKWAAASGCHSNCVAPGRGLRLVVAKDRGTTHSSIQLCDPDKLGCGRLKTPFEHATSVCSKYRERVRRLSGLGMQISAAATNGLSTVDPDRPCRVACQDEEVTHRFYLVNGEDGWFPFGTDCSRGVVDKKAFCVSGKCLEFGSDDTPLSELEYTLPLLNRSKRTLLRNTTRIMAILDQETLNLIISTLNLTGNSPPLCKPAHHQFSIDLNNPVHLEAKTSEFAVEQVNKVPTDHS